MYRVIGRAGFCHGVKQARYDYETGYRRSEAVVDGGMSKPEMVRFGIRVRQC